MLVTDSQIERFHNDGWIRLGRVADAESFEYLRRRAADICHGRVSHPGMYFQLDSDTGEYGDLEAGGEFRGPSDNYRKIEGWERDPLFLAYMRHPVFRDLTRRLIGERIGIYRAMFMNKPANRGTILPYHQDGGEQWRLTSVDASKYLTVWTALDDATIANGCVELAPGSHKLGLLSDFGHTITPEQEAEHAPPEKSVFVEVEAGEVFAIHNLLLHRSGVNRTDKPRRGFSVCYLDGNIKRRRGDTLEELPILWP